VKARLVRQRRYFSVLFVCLAYGGVHAAAWNFEFPSEAEQLLWKISSVTIMAGSIAVSYMSVILSNQFLPDVTKHSVVMKALSNLRYSKFAQY